MQKKPTIMTPNGFEQLHPLSQRNEPSPQTLLHKIRTQTEYALSCGALQPIPTSYEFLEQDGVKFLVRSLDNLARKEKAKQNAQKSTQSGKPVNPFLPYEQDLFITHLSNTHVCLLNKYNVIEHHILIVTRAFEEQETWLNDKDFLALWQCLAEIDGLAFYNGGTEAGASQPHKHLQLVPTSLAPDNHTMPIEGIIRESILGSNIPIHSEKQRTQNSTETLQIQTLPFAHAIAPLNLDPNIISDPDQAKDILLTSYKKLLKAVGVKKPFIQSRQSLPYNLLITRRWMIIVPRIRESYSSISVNSLGFAGSLFVKNEDQMQILKQAGPMRILQHVAQPKPIAS